MAAQFGNTVGIPVWALESIHTYMVHIHVGRLRYVEMYMVLGAAGVGFS